MRKHLAVHPYIFGFIGAAPVAALVSISIMAALGWQPSAAPSPATRLSAAHFRPQGLMAAAFLGSLALAPNPAAPSGNAFTGVAEYFPSGAFSFTVPAGVTSVLVQFYGAGGGGSYGTSTNRGGAGGVGAYVMSVVTVIPGATYTINVGAAGVAGPINEPGGNGGDTSFVDSGGAVIVAAGGGQGGAVSGQGGAGGQPIGNPMVGHAGHTAVNTASNVGYVLATFYEGTPLGLHEYIGTGGNGRQRSSGFGGPGIEGYALIAW